MIKKELKNEDNIKRSRQWDIPLTSIPEKVFRFEIIIYNDTKLVLSLLNVKDKTTKYESEFDYQGILKEFGVLPQNVKEELRNLTDFQVFMAGLAKNKKIELFLGNHNDLRMEFLDVAKAPKGAIYNVTVNLYKIN